MQANHPTAQTILVGADTPKVSYGAHRTDNRGWLTALRDEMGNQLDWKRIHALGQVPHTVLRDVYRISAAHVYLSYPFVLGWSLLEAMACGCSIVGSTGMPVEEVITNGVNGLLVPMDKPNELVSKVHALLSNSQLREVIGKEARKTALDFDQSRTLPRILDVITNP